MDIPDFIYNKTTSKAVKKTNKPSHTRTSQFLLTINPNLGTKKLDNETIKQIYINLENTKNKLKENIKEYVKSMPGKKNFIPPDLIKFEAQHERGEMVGKLHTHIYIQFDNLCYMNVDKLKEIYDNEFSIVNPISRYNELKQAGKKPMRIEAKYIKDELNTSINYIFKGQNKNSEDKDNNQDKEKIITQDELPKSKSNNTINDDEKYELSSLLDGFILNNNGFPKPKIFRHKY
jgi:hypothetical protein